MGLKILAWSNGIMQHSGYATCQKHLLPRINRQTDHEVIQLAASGLQQGPPITIKGVKVFPYSEFSGKLAQGDVEYLAEAEDVDLIWPQIDVWAIHEAVHNLATSPKIPPMVVYAPIDHHGPEYMPAPIRWRPVFEGADMMVPYCEFGKRVMEEHGLDDDKIWDPIFHGVDPEIFSPDVEELERGLEEDAFVVGDFKALQGTRSGHERALRSFRDFLEAEDAWDDAYMYMHCNTKGRGAFDFPTLVSEFDLGDNVFIPSPSEYRWFADDERMARLYASCDVLLNPVRGEGFGLPILEAMACEIPVIAGAYSSMPELVLGEEGEITHEDVDEPVIEAPRGWVVPSWDEEMTMGKHNYRRRYNPDHIVAALREAYNNPAACEQKGRNGREFAKQHTWEDKAAKFIDLFDHLEEELWETDETTGIDWLTIGEEGDEHGGVNALGGVAGQQ